MFMKGFSYENIWVRNGVLFSLMMSLLYIDSRLNPQEPSVTPGAALLVALAMYLMLLVHNLILLKQWLLEKKVLVYVSVFVPYLVAITFTFRWLSDLFSSYLPPEEPVSFGSELIGNFFFLLVGSGFYFTHLWIMTNLVNTKKRMLHTETELAQLKQQLNPHFLLNALNNLYGVALASPQALPEKILELSELLVYQIETSKKEWITLQEEMNFANQYLHYMEWKTNGMKVNIEVLGEAPNYRLTPMIFLPLLENAVKYASETKDPTITVQWTFEKRQICVMVKNSFNTGVKQRKTTGIGIDNLRRRLELYHPQHELILSEENNQFTARLELWNLSIVA